MPARKTAQPPLRPASKSSWLSRTADWLLRKPKAAPTPAGLPAAPSRAAAAKPRRAKPNPRHLVALTKAETLELPPFTGLALTHIHVPVTAAECAAAAEEILAAGVAGFDTESKPNFKAGEKSTGPHVVQFAVADKAFIFQMRGADALQVAADLIASNRVLKVGFGLRNDHGQIRNRMGVQLQNVLDLDHVFRKRGYKGQLGVRAAMGAVLQLSFPKSKSTTTSNWAAPALSPKQLLYAANDAFAALKIKEALDLKNQ